MGKPGGRGIAPSNHLSLLDTLHVGSQPLAVQELSRELPI